ncbi:MAG: ATP-binding cassette domain-containing protein [Acidobacteria bacterium]|nr:ATP-binding cassette domain-containing protein [Acidobacteriota bacterium]
MTSAISIRELTKTYGRRTAVDAATYDVPRGSVCGLLGQNGAGKTTTIRCMLDLLRPTSGTIEVLGLDAQRDSVEIRRRIGYLPEEPTYYPWMRVGEITRFNAGFYPTWDQQLCDTLIAQLGLPSDRKLRDLSRGMQAKVGLVLALSQRPELLVLDDPTSGLDPIVRRQFFEAMIDKVHATEGTVFFSTHLLHEMERIADEVVVMYDGRVLVRDSLEALKRSRRRLRAVFSGDSAPAAEHLPVRLVESRPHFRDFTARRFDAGLVAGLRDAGFDSVEVIDMDLEDIFVDEIGRAGGALDGADTTTSRETAA